MSRSWTRHLGNAFLKLSTPSAVMSVPSTRRFRIPFISLSNAVASSSRGVSIMPSEMDRKPIPGSFRSSRSPPHYTHQLRLSSHLTVQTLSSVVVVVCLAESESTSALVFMRTSVPSCLYRLLLKADYRQAFKTPRRQNPWRVGARNAPICGTIHRVFETIVLVKDSLNLLSL